MYKINSLAIIVLLLIYPFFIAKKIREIISSEETNIGQIFRNIFILAASLIALIIAITPALEWFDNAMPSSTSGNCTNGGGFSYSCKGNDSLAIIPLLVLGIIITIHHFITLKYVYNIFKYCKNIFTYIFMYLYMGAIYVIDFFILLSLYGLFVSYSFNIIVNIIRIIIVILPFGLYFISYKINKNKQ